MSKLNNIVSGVVVPLVRDAITPLIPGALYLNLYDNQITVGKQLERLRNEENVSRARKVALEYTSRATGILYGTIAEMLTFPGLVDNAARIGYDENAMNNFIFIYCMRSLVYHGLNILKEKRAEIVENAIKRRETMKAFERPDINQIRD